MADYTPKTTGGPYTSTTSGTVTGGRLCTASGDGTVAESAAGDHPVGITAHDAAASARVTVIPIAGYIHVTVVENAQVIAAGGPIIAGATGFVKSGVLAATSAAGTWLGTCLVGGTGDAAGTVTATWIGGG